MPYAESRMSVFKLTEEKDKRWLDYDVQEPT